MNRLLSILTTLCLGLWAGSLVHLVLTVSTLFKSFPKAQSTIAIEAAPIVFWITERYHLFLSVFSILLIAGWRLVSCSRPKRVMTWLLVLAALLAFTQTFALSAKMDALRKDGQGGGPAFTTLHHVSTTQYMIQTVLVIAALAFLPAAAASRNDACAPTSNP